MRFGIRLSLTALSLSAASAAFAQAAPTTVEGRVGKLEKEMKAVQRTVFPQGVPVEPETGLPTAPSAAGIAASTPLADLTARVDALERQVASLTGQVETMQNEGRKIDERLKALEARLATPEVAASTVVPTVAAPAPTPVVTTLATPPRPALKPAALPSPARPDAARKAALAAIEVPATGDVPEDAYTYGFRLYTAKLFPEAQAKLKEFVAAYPKHKRASYAQNLLGRAYFDEGKPALASVAFYENYQKMPKGDRASESLYWLGQSLMKLNKPGDACKAYGEFGDVYGATAPADLKARVAKGRVDAKCAA